MKQLTDILYTEELTAYYMITSEELHSKIHKLQLGNKPTATGVSDFQSVYFVVCEEQGCVH
jgi:hypothetical protein